MTPSVNTHWISAHGRTAQGCASLRSLVKRSSCAVYLTLTLGGLFAIPTDAQAQIYSWRDAKGVLVLADHPPTDESTDARIIVAGKTSVATETAGVMPAAKRFAFATSGRGAAFDQMIASHASNYGVRPELVRAVIRQESGFNPRAVSPKGAMGLMQLMPATAGELGVVDAFNPDDNIRGGVAYLKRLLDRYEHNEELALAAYNAGPAAVARYGNRVPPYRETIEYVSRIRTSTRLQARVALPPPQFVYRLAAAGPNGTPLYSNVKPASGPFGVVAGTLR